MKVTRFNHAAINVEGKLESVRDFYLRFLGIPVADRGEMAQLIDGEWLQLGETQIHIIDAPYAGEERNPLGPHISLYVDDLEGGVSELEARGLEMVSIGEGLGRIVWVTDPAGNTVEFQQDPLLVAAD